MRNRKWSIIILKDRWGILAKCQVGYDYRWDFVEALKTTTRDFDATLSIDGGIVQEPHTQKVGRE